MKSILLRDFQTAQKKILPWIQKTPLNYSRTFSEYAGSKVYLKMENMQITGSFKIRGALNKIFHLTKEEKNRGVITCSAGNHAQGVAYASRCVKTSSLIVLPENTAAVKQAAARHYGAELVLKGKIYDESYAYATQMCKENQRVFIHAYQDPFVIAGQGSLGLEIMKQLPNLDSVIVPIGGGGLISGVAAAIKQLNHKCRIYGVVSHSAPAMEYLFHGKPYKAEKDFHPTNLTDGINVKHSNPEIFQYISKYVDDIVSVRDKEVETAMLLLLERGKTLVEGAGAASIAALLKQTTKWNLGKKSVVILSGGNIDLHSISQIITKKNWNDKKWIV